ncbi:uncharacterized protein MKK02DRAFT_19734 [Dioszegia hungarica]|uniref:Respiratory supercomplex factor 1, mitochondrial n=1 Tax=Dioszegia hungarica TaxID=4972 RepID=A0AA38LSR3_9TREE|nr:uncharacterized protein MKK02DRAFT_19734 [Dioszegia hungarica]KAI9632939.1 hypothetical protein MKK02DRAFT_19734 [Dioszegia hungarica]
MVSASELAARANREEQTERAYRIQIEGGLQGALRWTMYGAAVVTLAHFTWPLFSRQTLAIKGFLVSSSSIFGLVVGADSHLFKYEHELRMQENEVRKYARNALAMEGKIATEREIGEWRMKNESRVMKEIEERRAARRAAAEE